MFKIAYSKPNKRFVAKSVKEEKNYEYIKYIFRKIIKRVNAGKKSLRRNGTKRQLSLRVGPRDRPSRDEIISRSQKIQTYQIVNITNSGPSRFYLLKINPLQVSFGVIGILLAGEFRLESVFQQASIYSKLILKVFKEYNMITVAKYEFALTCSFMV